MRTNENHCVIDVSDSLHKFKQLAPPILNQYISFKEYVTILTSTPMTPGRDEYTINALLDTIDGKIHNTELIDTILSPSNVERLEIFSDIFIEEFDNSILRHIDFSQNCDLDNVYEITQWLGDTSVIVKY